MIEQMVKQNITSSFFNSFFFCGALAVYMTGLSLIIHRLVGEESIFFQLFVSKNIEYSLYQRFPNFLPHLFL